MLCVHLKYFIDDWNHLSETTFICIVLFSRRIYWIWVECIRMRRGVSYYWKTDKYWKKTENIQCRFVRFCMKLPHTNMSNGPEKWNWQFSVFFSTFQYFSVIQKSSIPVHMIRSTYWKTLTGIEMYWEQLSIVIYPLARIQFPNTFQIARWRSATKRRKK